MLGIESVTNAIRDLFNNKLRKAANVIPGIIMLCSLAKRPGLSTLISFGLLNSILTQLIIPFLLYILFSNYDTLLGLSLVAQLIRLCLQCRRPGFNPRVGMIPWRRERLPTPIFWPGEFHGLYSPRGHKQ